MGHGTDAVRQHYELAGLTERILQALADRGLDPEHLSEAELAELDEFHTGGRHITRRLAELAEIGPDDQILDVGAGIGGPARFLASTYGCSVTALDLVDEFCATAEELDRRTGLDRLITVAQGNATDLRFPDRAFDVVWTEHTAMNVEDKHAMYTEFRRVVRPGGRLAMFDVVAGEGGALRLPVPWASAPGQSFLENAEVVRKLLVATGWEPIVWLDMTEEIARGLRSDGEESLGDLLMRDAAAMRTTYSANLAENRARLLLAVSRAT